MKKRLLSSLLCLCMVVGMLPTLMLEAKAIGDYGVNLGSSYYTSGNPFSGVGNGHECTWYCWGRAMEKCGIDLPCRGNANTWYSAAQNAVASGRRDFSVGTTPKANSILVTKGLGTENYATGHVRFIESVQNTTVYYSESNNVTSIQPAQYYQGTYNANSSKIYPGNSKYEEEIIGYIYLGDSSQPTVPSQNLGDDFYAYIKSEVGNVNLENIWGNNVQTSTTNQSDPRQIWHFIRQSDGSYKIVSMADGCCLDVRDAVYAAGTNIQTHTDNGGNAQRWRLISCGRDSESVYKIATVVGDYRLDVAGASAASGTNIQLFGDNDWMHAQEFKIIKRSSAGEGLAGYLPINSYARISFKGAYLQTTGTTINGKGMDVQLTRSLRDDPKQIWHFMWQTDGSYKIVNEYNGWCLDAQGGIASNRTKVWTWYDDHGGSPERWYPIYFPKDGNFRLASAMFYPWTSDGNHIAYMVDIPDGSTSEGTNIQIWQQTDGGNQQLAITREDYVRPPRPAAPTNVQLITNEERTAVMWKAVPATSAYDSRQYDVIVYDSGSNVVFRGSTADTALVSNQVLQPGHYEIYVRAVNTKYPSSASNYASGYTNVPADVVLTYSVSMRATEGGTIKGAGVYPANTSVTVTAAPRDGYRFVEWQEDDSKVSEAASYTFSITKNRELTAVFEANTPPAPTMHTISVSTSGGGTVTGGGSYEDGGSATVIATPASGYEFKEWTESGTQVSASASYTFTVGQDRELVAVFEEKEQPPTPPEKYTVSVNASPSVGGTVEGGGSYDADTSVIVIATANSGYQFKEWRENGSSVSTSAAYTFNADASRVLTAVFEAVVTPPVSYTVRVNVTSGGTASGGGTYHNGDQVTVTAVPNAGYQFKGWTEGGTTVSTQASYTFTADASRELTAAFESTTTQDPKLTYTLEVSASPTEGGVVTGHGNSTYEAGTSITITAAANAGYRFVRWVENGSIVGEDASYTFSISENRNLTAVFELENPAPKSTYTITVSASPAEHGSVTGGGTYQEGEAVTITAIANSGYQFKEWWLNGRQISTTASYTFTASANQDFTAIFEKQTDIPTPPAPNTYTVSVSPATGGTVTGGGTFAESSTVTVTAIANSSHRFTGWFENGRQVSASASYTFIVNSDRNLVAGFTYVGGSTNTSGGNPSSGNANDTSSSRPSIPVKTDGTNNNMTTTASPNATIRGDTAASVITSEIVREIINQAVKTDSGEVVIAPVVKTDVTRAEVTLPAAALTEIEQKTNAGLVISTPHADVRLQNSGLSTLSDRQAVVVATERTGTDLVLSITANGQTVEHVPGGVILTAPVDHSTPGTVAVVVHEDGSRQVIRKSTVDGDTITIPLDGSTRLEIIDNAKVFTDVNADSWAANAVAFVSGHELFSGTGPDRFNPDQPMTRGMLAVVLHNLENNPEQVFSARFSDVADSIWYSDAILWAAKQGIVSGYGDGRFGPNDNITREQLAVMLWRYAGEPAATNKELHFSDADAASSYALEALCWAVEHSIINGYGDGQLGPQKLATRAQVAQMLKNFLET